MTEILQDVSPRSRLDAPSNDCKCPPIPNGMGYIIGLHFTIRKAEEKNHNPTQPPAVPQLAVKNGECFGGKIRVQVSIVLVWFMLLLLGRGIWTGSPDDKPMYFTDSPTETIVAYYHDSEKDSI